MGRRRYLGVLASVALVVMLAVPPASATDDPAGSEAFRTQLTTYFADLEQAYTRVVDAGGDPAVLDRIRATRQALPQLADADLAVLAAAIGGNPGWWEVPATLERIFSAPAARSAPKAPLGAAALPTCPDGTPLGVTDEYIAQGVALAAALVMELLPTDGITIAAREAPAVAWAAAETAVLVLQGLNAVADECETNNLRTYTYTSLETRTVDLQVIRISESRLLLVATESGAPVAATLTGLSVAIARAEGPLTFADATGQAKVTDAGTGLLDVDLSAIRGTKVVQATVECTHADAHKGSVTYHTGWERP